MRTQAPKATVRSDYWNTVLDDDQKDGDCTAGSSTLLESQDDDSSVAELIAAFKKFPQDDNSLQPEDFQQHYKRIWKNGGLPICLRDDALVEQAAHIAVAEPDVQPRTIPRMYKVHHLQWHSLRFAGKWSPYEQPVFPEGDTLVDQAAYTVVAEPSVYGSTMPRMNNVQRSQLYYFDHDGQCWYYDPPAHPAALARFTPMEAEFSQMQQSNSLPQPQFFPPNYTNNWKVDRIVPEIPVGEDTPEDRAFRAGIVLVEAQFDEVTQSSINQMLQNNNPAQPQYFPPSYLGNRKMDRLVVDIPVGADTAEGRAALAEYRHMDAHFSQMQQSCSLP